MTDQEILNKFSQILGALLADTSIELQMNTLRSDISGWDSFQYVNFIVAVEMEFGIKFRVGNVESFRSVGDIVSETQSLLS